MLVSTPSPSHAFPLEKLSPPWRAGPGSGGAADPSLGTIPSWHWHSGSESLPETLQEQWNLGALCRHILGNMLEHMRGTPHPPGHTLRYCEASGVGPAWAQLGASWQVLECSWDPHHECWGPYGVSTGKILGHNEDTKGPLETLKGYWETLWGVTGSKSTAPGIPRAIWDHRGTAPTGALWGPPGAPHHSFHKAFTLSCSSLDGEPGVGVRGGSLPRSQIPPALPQRGE